MARDLGTWDPLTPGEVAALLAGCSVPWWIAGGYAIDAFLGRLDRRQHEDVDVGLLARDQSAVRACLAGWELHCVDPPGSLRPWLEGEVLEEPLHDVWGRRGHRGSWRLALLLNTSEGDTWTYRRDPRVRRSVSDLVWRSEDIPYLVPEVQLLFKSTTMRDKDEVDFRASLPLLSGDQREWLHAALELVHPAHAWLPRL